jgi:hypothetical protein
MQHSKLSEYTTKHHNCTLTGANNIVSRQSENRGRTYTMAQQPRFTTTQNEQHHTTSTHKFHDATTIDDLGPFRPEIFNPVAADQISPAVCLTCHSNQTPAKKCLRCKVFLNDSQNRLVLVLRHLAYYKEKLHTAIGPDAQFEIEKRIGWLNAREAGIRLGANQIINRHNGIGGHWAQQQVVEFSWDAQPQPDPPYASPYAIPPPPKPSYPEPTTHSFQTWRPYGP